MAEIDPLDTPLPCDVKIEHITFKKGVALRALVNAATRWKRYSNPYTPPWFKDDRVLDSTGNAGVQAGSSDEAWKGNDAR